MKFHILTERDLCYINSRYPWDHSYLPDIQHEIAVPLYTALTGYNKIPHTRYYARNWNGFKIKDIVGSVNDIRTITCLTLPMLYCDKIEYYKNMYQEAEVNNIPYIDVKHTDIIKLSYRVESYQMNFIEQQYIIKTMPDMISNMLTYQNELDRSLADLQIKLI
jgi:hypothetical protein